MKIYDESLYCQECNCEISVAQSKFCNNYCDDCYEQDMQQLDTAVDPDGLDAQGQTAWNEYEKPNALEELCEGCHRKEEMCICGGVPDEDVRLESSVQRFMESQADQDYWARRAAEGHEPWHDHSPTCNCPECCGDEPEPVPGWPPSAQETVYYQEVMAKPDEF
jgi:hypothetical protein